MDDFSKYLLHSLSRLSAANDFAAVCSQSRAILFCFVLASLALLPLPGHAETEDTYQQVSPSVLQVLILDTTSATKSSFGSGFYVEGGYVVTNFHVISDLVFHPDRHRAEYRNHLDQRGELELVHFDVVNDLAIMRSADYLGPALDISEQAPANGSRIYAMGHPHDLGLSVVEGTYNGLLEQKMIPRIHLTGALNPGMSGGPALDTANRLVGVNVAGMGNGVSFLVPASFVLRLLSQVEHVDETRDFTSRVGDQIAQHQQRFLEPLLLQRFNMVELGDYQAAGQLNGAFECWGSTSEPDDRLFSTSSHRCETEEYIYLTAEDYTGTIEYRHEFFSTEQLGTHRFYAFLEQHLQTKHVSTSVDEKYATGFSCKQALVDNNGINMKLVSCLRAHKIIDELYDQFMIMTTVNHETEALYSVLMLSGVSYETGLKFQQRYLEAIRPGQQGDDSNVF